MTSLPEHFVTMTNRTFLPQLLCLYKSLVKIDFSFNLHVLCFCEDSKIILDKLNLEYLFPLALTDFEDDTLSSIKGVRTSREYFWTLTPQLPKFVLTLHPKIQRITYLDADLFFFKNPMKLIDKLVSSKKSVLITDHAFAPEFDQSARSGKYCVQFITFLFPDAEIVRKSWENKCIEWCFEIPQYNLYGDQKYLEHFVEDYKSHVFVLDNVEYCQAPWNHTRFSYSDAVFNHFQGLRIVRGDKVEFADYPIPRATFNNFYLPYLNELRCAVNQLNTVGFSTPIQAKPTSIFRKFARKVRHYIRLAQDRSVPSSNKF